jgi:hypothetical protein
LKMPRPSWKTRRRSGKTRHPSWKTRPPRPPQPEHLAAPPYTALTWVSRRIAILRVRSC